MHRFESTYQRHLAQEQRKAVLDALAQKLEPDATVGDVLDAAESLGWGERMGELSLQDLADALLREDHDDEFVANDDGAETESEDEDEEDEEGEDEEDEDEEGVVETKASRGSKTKAKAKAKSKSTTKKTKAKGTKKAATKPKSKAATKKTKATKATKATGAKKTASTKKASGKKSSKRGSGLSAAKMRALKKKVDADDRMSLEEAAELFVPIVEEMGEATMQDLEELTGVGRRKLRFHIGQLVRHDYLARHGMGRGTHYTVA